MKHDHCQKEKKDFNIIINGRVQEVVDKVLSFLELVKLAFGSIPTDPNTCYTITYKRGQGNKPEGHLVEGEEVKLKRRMIFNVTQTNKS
jgi:hypothetical protein